MRLDDWQTSLHGLIEANRQTPFAWGQFDCALWAGLCVEAVNGRDLYSPYRGKYKNALGSVKMLKKVDDVEQPVDLFVKHLGELQPIGFARPGDLVFKDDAQGMVPGVCIGATSIFVGENGLEEVTTLELSGAIWVS